jgi:hypothetical protein
MGSVEHHHPPHVDVRTNKTESLFGSSFKRLLQQNRPEAAENNMRPNVGDWGMT